MSEPIQEPAAIVGEVEAGRAGKVRREINKLISSVNSNTFDLAERLTEVKENQYYTGWGFESYSKYAKSIEGLKYTKAFYLVAIVQLMKGCAFNRDEYEPIGLGKLRAISRLKLEGEFNGIPMPMVIRELVLKASTMSLEEVNLQVDTILGLTEDESMVWINIHLKKIARDNVVKVAFDLIRKHIPQTEGDDGVKKDASDGACLEMMAANILADPNWNTETESDGVEETNESIEDPSPEV